MRLFNRTVLGLVVLVLLIAVFYQIDNLMGISYGKIADSTADSESRSSAPVVLNQNVIGVNLNPITKADPEIMVHKLLLISAGFITKLIIRRPSL